MLLRWTSFNFGFNLLIIIGMWKLNTKNRIKLSIFCFYRVLMWTIFGALFNILQLIDLYLVLSDLEKLSINCRSTLLFTMCLCASLDSFLKSKRITDLKMKYDEREINIKNDEVAGKIYLEGDKELKFLSRFFTFWTYVTVAIWSFTAFFDSESRSLPDRIWLPFDLKPPQNFYPVAIFEILGNFYFTTYLLGSAYAIAGFFIRIIAEYKILEKKIDAIKQIRYNNAKDYRLKWNVLKERETLRLTKEIIASHQEILL